MNDYNEMKPLDEYLQEKQDVDKYSPYSMADDIDKPIEFLREQLSVKLNNSDFEKISAYCQAEVNSMMWEERRETMVRILSLISASKRPSLEVDLLYLIMSQGLTENKGIQATISRKYDVSRQYISKRVLDLCDELNIVNPSGRGEKARELYREVQQVDPVDVDRLSIIRAEALKAINGNTL